ncbi:MAG TPA: transposase [bacterium]|nr:transposase [bacterium]
MARPLRIEYPGALYHVINRGHRKEKIFRRIADREVFLEKLIAARRKFGIVVHAYCLMDNHFHLLIETPNANLARAMHTFHASYANWFRVKYQLVGSVFQGRYKAVLVERDDYLVRLSAYIHLNPVRARIVAEPEEHRWSSYGQYLSGEATELLSPATVLKYAGGSENYQTIIDRMQGEDILPEEMYGRNALIGGDDFRVKMREQVADRAVDANELPEYRGLRQVTPEAVEKAVCAVFGVKKSDLTKKYERGEARRVYLYLLKRRTALTLAEIGRLLGMSANAVATAARVFEKGLATGGKVAGRVNKIEGGLA